MSYSDPAHAFQAVTPSDSTVLGNTTGPVRALYVGGTGNVVVQSSDGVSITFANVQAGSILPIRAVKVMAATTATSIVALI